VAIMALTEQLEKRYRSGSLSDDNEKSEKSEKLAISNKSESEDNLGQLGKKRREGK